MNTATAQIIVSIIANNPSKNITFPLTHSEQLQTLRQDYMPSDVAAVDFEVSHDRRALNGVKHRFVASRKRFDTIEQFITFAERHYV